MNAHSEQVEQPLAELLRQVSQAHFLQPLTAPEALAILQARRACLRSLLEADWRQEQHSSAALLLEHFHLLLAAELAWIERAIAALQEHDNYPGMYVENTGRRDC